MENKYNSIRITSFVTLTMLSLVGIANINGQPSSTPMNNMTQQHAVHILDNLVISQHIPLRGHLVSGDYIMLMDFTPFATSVEGHSHIAIKIPCTKEGTAKATVVSGIAPNLKSLDMGNAINNGTLNGKGIDLSDEGNSCLYHAELPNGITDIAMVNTSNETLDFDRGGYSVIVTVHGSAVQHLATNETAK